MNTYQRRVAKGYRSIDRARWRDSMNGRGTCDTCGRRNIALDDAGNLHRHAPRLGLGHAAECAGTGMMPTLARKSA